MCFKVGNEGLKDLAPPHWSLVMEKDRSMLNQPNLNVVCLVRPCNECPLIIQQLAFNDFNIVGPINFNILHQPAPDDLTAKLRLSKSVPNSCCKWQCITRSTSEHIGVCKNADITSMHASLKSPLCLQLQNQSVMDTATPPFKFVWRQK